MIRAKNLEEVVTMLEKIQGVVKHDEETCTCLSCTILPAIREAIEREEDAYRVGM